LISALLTLILVVVARVIAGDSMFDPGGLNAIQGDLLGGVSSHAQTGRDCGRCHPPFWSAETMADLCLSCHTAIRSEMGDATSLHGTLFQDSLSICQVCHTEHHGSNASLTIWSDISFPHDNTGFSLAGHTTRADGMTFDCNDCHVQGFSSFAVQTCLDCHLLVDQAFAQAHLQDFDTACLACHDGIDRYGDFDHNQQIFPLVGEHLQAGCSQCHMDDRSIADLQATPTDCVSCHRAEDAHGGEFGERCGVCHHPAGWTPTVYDHTLTDFNLEGKHIDVACDDCHVSRYMGTPEDCFSCHAQDDPHQGEFGTGCESCHEPSGWENITFDHDLSAFPLDGAHVNLECSECHKDGVFRDTPTECAACHEEPAFHLGLFTGQACSACHTTAAWSPASFEGLHTFPMNHGEQVNTCSDCHQPDLTQWICFPCHDRVAVDEEHDKEGIINTSDCLSCHPTGEEDEGNGGSED